MKMRTLVYQTMFLSASHFLVRVIGFAMRIWLSRKLGALAIGLVELAGSAQMLLITPVISGLPAAMSRVCAKSEPEKQVRVLRCGIALSLLISLPLSALAFSLRTPLSLWLGDVRTLPALLVYLPCIPVLGVSCALNGYYYGTGRPVPPAVSEIIEQVVRFILTLRLVSALRGWPVMLRAAIPGMATLAGETIALLLMLLITGKILFFAPAKGSRRQIMCEITSLALPLTGMKLVSSLMRTVQSVLIPARLQASGLAAGEALSRLGMLNGMLMPVLMLPSFITCSLSMVAAPELTRRQAQGHDQQRLVRRVLTATLLIGLAAAAAVFLFAPVFAHTLYRQAELLPLLRWCCLLVPVMSLSQVVSALMNGLGLQGTSLRIAVGTNLLSTLMTYALAAQPFLQLWGVILAMAAAQIITLFLSLRTLLKAAEA
ncbi:MAG: oligosaccharide flippase family protein [Clostridia bacterium]|nr:oligosaccharide flippase family protein [Clostridia bacterium]